ncbi:hypothetical protein [Terricaulis sp.]|uniref:hypothetical protein n=1 Tax=Terricaulis sp. TaxID=2768686 RepID=UPI0037851CAE
MRLVQSIAAAAVLALAACGQSTTATTASTEQTATTADAGESMSMSMSASSSSPAQEAANCMAYTTLERQAVLSGRAQGDAMALLQATAAWRASVADQPEANQFYQAAMGAYNTMDAADLKAAADDCVARAPAAH